MSARSASLSDKQFRAICDLLDLKWPDNGPVLRRVLDHKISVVRSWRRRAETAGSLKDGRRWLAAVNSASVRLAEHLSADPALSASLVLAAGCFPVRMAEPVPEVIERSQDGLTLLLRALEALAKHSHSVTVDENDLRSTLQLPPSAEARNTFVSDEFWPELFLIYGEAGHRIGFSTAGPLYRFLSVMHEAADLPPPAEGTLRDAIRGWRPSGRTRSMSRWADQSVETILMRSLRWTKGEEDPTEH